MADDVPRTQIIEVVAGLRRLLDAIQRDELTAGPGLIARLEGAQAALDALAGNASHQQTSGGLDGDD